MITFYTRALLLLRRPPCWNKHDAARTTRHLDLTSEVTYGVQRTAAPTGLTTPVHCISRPIIHPLSLDNKDT